MNPQPPKWANRFLEWYCAPELLEEIQGDVHELFYRNAKESKRFASLQFSWNVLRFLRLRNIRKTKRNYTPSAPTAMIKSYFLTGFRSIVRNLVPSFINIFGLAVALGCAVTIFLLLDSYYDLDSMHTKGDRIYLVTDHVKGSDESQHWANSPYRIGPAMAQDNPGIETVVRIQLERGVNVRHKDAVFSERVWFVDKSFLDVFSFPIIQGNKDALHDKNQIVITRGMADKYFGQEDPIGKVLSLKFNATTREEFTVGAVAEKISDNSSMFFNFLLSMEKYEDLKLTDTDTWKKFTNATFVLMQPGHRPAELAGSMENYRKLHNDTDFSWPILSFEFIPLPEVAKRSYQLENSLSWSNHPAAMIALGVIAALLVLLACFNYMNVAVASVSTRLKEIGIRKVTGGAKKDIIWQFLIENIMLCAVALTAGTTVAYFFFIPGFNSLYEVHIPFVFSSATMLIAFFAGMLIFVALLSGAYPALYVSSFSPVSILKGKEKFGSKSRFSKILLGTQFALAFTTIVACLVFASSSYYFETLDWGYDHAQNIVVPVQTKEQFLALKDLVATDKNVIRFSGSKSHIGHSNKYNIVSMGPEKYSVTHFPVGYDYLETMNVRLQVGRFLKREIESDVRESAVVNESFVKKMGWTEPVGQSFHVDSARYFVIGVVSDFHNNDFFYRIEPMMFTIVPEDEFQYIVVTADAGHIQETADFLKSSWKKIAPDDPYRGFYQDEVFASMFRSNRSNNKVLYVVSGVALLLSCMGLYGLVSYNLTRRLREFSVRKVFGANLLHIFRLMNGDYIWIVLISFGIGAPLGFYLMKQMLFAVYPYPIPLATWPFFATIGVMIATVAITISTQLNRVAKENPTVTLRTE